VSDQIRVNGNLVSWGSIILKLDGERFYGFTSITYADKRERVKAYGMGRHHAPRGRSRGKYTTDPVKLEGWKGSVQIFREALALKSADGKSYGDVEFQALVQYVESSISSDRPLNVEIDRCVWTANSVTDAEDADPKKEEIELDCMLIVRNGLTLFDSASGAP
jgi:hypothetical protein